MITDRILKLLNDQIKIEGESSQIYLAMYAWAMKFGLEGTAKFFLEQSEEERKHMLKLFVYINDKGERAKVTQLDAPSFDFIGLKEVFEATFDHEMFVTGKINDLIMAANDDKDYSTSIFLQWYALEQVEEEGLIRRILDRIKWAKDNPAAILEVDEFISEIRGT